MSRPSAFRVPSSAFPFLAALPVAIVGTILLCQCIELFLATRLLEHAARAAAIEAALPAADAASIQTAIHRVLVGSDLQDCIERPMIWIDGQPASAAELCDRASGVEIAVFLSAQVTDVVPDLLEPLGMSLAGRRMTSSQSCVKP
jgi:hypothetical protein